MMDQGNSTGSRSSEKVTPAPSLPFVVECKSFAAFYEPIAAFNHIKVAYQYAQECKRVNSELEYRLRDLETSQIHIVHAYQTPKWAA